MTSCVVLCTLLKTYSNMFGLSLFKARPCLRPLLRVCVQPKVVAVSNTRPAHHNKGPPAGCTPHYCYCMYCYFRIACSCCSSCSCCFCCNSACFNTQHTHTYTHNETHTHTHTFIMPLSGRRRDSLSTETLRGSQRAPQNAASSTNTTG